MPTPRKALLRLAVAINRQLCGPASNPLPIELPTASWRELERLARLIGHARERNWKLAATRLTREFTLRMEVLRGETAELAERLTASVAPRSSVALLDVYRDLIALQHEFTDVQWSIRAKTLSVITEQIVLHGVDLGTFEICLSWCRHESPSYRVVAREPNPAACNSSVTHPHVEDEALCEGEARVPLRKALADGRLADFFLIVAGALRTYNESSPFVSLDRWYGIDCTHCDGRVDEDQVCNCQTCSARLCEGCCIGCPTCSDMSCYECAQPCSTCNADHCRDCLTRCRDCRRRICSECLQENERCKTCHEKVKEQQVETEIPAAIG